MATVVAMPVSADEEKAAPTTRPSAKLWRLSPTITIRASRGTPCPANTKTDCLAPLVLSQKSLPLTVIITTRATNYTPQYWAGQKSVNGWETGCCVCVCACVCARVLLCIGVLVPGSSEVISVHSKSSTVSCRSDRHRNHPCFISIFTFILWKCIYGLLSIWT